MLFAKWNVACRRQAAKPPSLRAKRRTGMIPLGEKGAKVLAVYVVEKGKPLATP
jgi:hypothetical protein